jgi:serine/threonine protein kinase
MALTSGNRLGPYEILAPLGAGGMGEVYRARDERLKREVAIKVLPASLSADADRLRRFEHEAQAAGSLNHPNITAVYDIGTHDGAPYVVQELLEGETLRAIIAGGKLSPRKAIDYALQVAQGLAAAHEKGIVHRDLKPENLVVMRDGRIKILDFGLAKLTRPETGVGPMTSAPTATVGTEPGIVLGTIGYMAPEQVRGQAADARSDIFTLGAILYEMLSGKRAFLGDSAADTMSAILREEPAELSTTNQSISPGLERIVRHCLEKNPEQRFQSARDLAFDLEALSGASAPRLEPMSLKASGRPLRRPSGLEDEPGLPSLFPHPHVSPRARMVRPLRSRRADHHLRSVMGRHAQVRALLGAGREPGVPSAHAPPGTGRIDLAQRRNAPLESCLRLLDWSHENRHAFAGTPLRQRATRPARRHRRCGLVARRQRARDRAGAPASLPPGVPDRQDSLRDEKRVDQSPAGVSERRLRGVSRTSCFRR